MPAWEGSSYASAPEWAKKVSYKVVNMICIVVWFPHQAVHHEPSRVLRREATEEDDMETISIDSTEDRLNQRPETGHMTLPPYQMLSSLSPQGKTEALQKGGGCWGERIDEGIEGLIRSFQE